MSPNPSSKLPATAAERRRATRAGWWLKLMVASAMAIGWMYILNPYGRGASTIQQLLIGLDVFRADTLPLYIKAVISSPVIAGFLGWYLHLLSYFFVKAINEDVISARVYSLLFRKFLFTYGVALILPPIQSVGESQQLSLMVFFIGYFPLSALSLLKESAGKLAQGMQPEKGQLSELTGVSRWEITRLQEKGIDSIATLAYTPPDDIKTAIPAMAPLVDFWIDIAQLYTLLGQDNYQKVKPLCMTASEFVIKARDGAFCDAVQAAGAGDAGEVARLLVRTFADRMIPANLDGRAPTATTPLPVSKDSVWR